MRGQRALRSWVQDENLLDLLEPSASLWRIRVWGLSGCAIGDVRVAFAVHNPDGTRNQCDVVTLTESPIEVAVAGNHIRLLGTNDTLHDVLIVWLCERVGESDGGR